MTAPFLTTDSIRKCESEIWRSLAGVMQLTLEHWAGSDIVRSALKRVSNVIADQVERTSGKKGRRKWTR
jgi:hypothetical protein